jgi:hypothetical protein
MRNAIAKRELEAEETNHYTDFDPYLIRERNRLIHTEIDSLRLQEQLRKNRKPRGPGLATSIERDWEPEAGIAPFREAS